MYFYQLMSLYITSLNSGSNGNCYYIGNDEEAVLIDAGLSCRDTEKRMKSLGLSMDKVKAVFISHEHSDHIKGLVGIVNKYAMPFYITEGTFKRSSIVIKQTPVAFAAFQSINIGAIKVTGFPKYHDAADAHSFIINHQEITVGVFTDIGKPCENITRYFSQCHAAFLETNYDEAMLEKGSYPIHLKNRIRGGNGHLSNRQALEIFTKHKPPFMSHLLLAHLSRENNHPQLVEDLFRQHAADTEIIVASRYQPTALLVIEPAEENKILFNTKSLQIKRAARVMQLNLFE